MMNDNLNIQHPNGQMYPGSGLQSRPESLEQMRNNSGLVSFGMQQLTANNTKSMNNSSLVECDKTVLSQEKLME